MEIREDEPRQAPELDARMPRLTGMTLPEPAQFALAICYFGVTRTIVLEVVK